MKRFLLGTLLGLAILIVALLGWSYSWTFTDDGRMDYRAAAMVKLIQWQAQPPEQFVMNAQTRKRSNENTLRWLGERELRQVREIRDLTVPASTHEVPVRVYFPHTEKEGPLPIYIMIHGGGFWMGNDFRLEEPSARLVSDIAKVIVLAVDYRLAPEHPYPAALDDCYAVLEWAFRHGVKIGGDPDQIAVGGGSAGGNLSAALALRARDQQGPELSYMLLVQPSTDLTGASNVPPSRQYVLRTSGSMRNAYAPDPKTRALAYVSPLHADDHSGLPETYIITAQFDELRDQGEGLGAKIRATGTPVTIKRYSGVLHGFLGTPDVADKAMKAAAEAMGRALHGPS